MILVLFNLLVFILGIVLSIKAFKQIIVGNRCILLITLLLFEVEYILPLVAESLWYLLQLKIKMFPAMDYALCDTLTGYLYLIFATSVQLILFKIGSNTYISIKDLKFPKIPKELFFLFKCLRFLPLIMVVLSPNPIVYLTSYAPFVFHRDSLSESAILFHGKFMILSTTVAFISTMFVCLFREKTTKKKEMIQYLAIFIYVFLNGKRTLLAFSVLGYVAIGVLKSPKINIKKIVIEMLGVLVFFVAYSLFSGKGDYYGSRTMNLLMNYLMYFDRAFITKVAIFNRLHPDLVHILDYSGQSILFNFFFWIPRIFWNNKPYPYAVYFTSGAVGNMSFYMVPWRFQTSVYPEWISNFGAFGIVLLLIIYFWFVRVTEKKKNFLIYFIGLIYSLFLQMFEFTGTPQYFILLWIFLIFISLLDKKYIIGFNAHGRQLQ